MEVLLVLAAEVLEEDLVEVELVVIELRSLVEQNYI